MSGMSEKKGKDLLLAILDELRNLDPKIVPFDSDEIQSLEYGVAQGVRDVFGSESPEYREFESFRVAAGNISRGDSRSEKQSKYELGLPRAVGRLEELLRLIDLSEEHLKDLSPEDLVEVKPPSTAPPSKAPPPGTAPSGTASAQKSRGPDKAPASGPKTEPAAAASTAKSSPAPTPQPGRILLLQEGGDDITAVVKNLLEKIGVGIALLDEDSPSEMEAIISLKDIAFTIMTVSSGPRGGLSGLTSVIGKPHPRYEIAFKLGLLVGNLGPGKVAILHGGERPQDIPDELYGIRYIPFKEEGGWQIGLLKLLKATGFFIDANLLFD